MKPLTLRIIASSLLFIISFLFFTYLYPYHLFHHEKMQLFLWSSSYAWDTICLPGGLADWLSRFLVQFFVSPYIASLIISTLFVLLQLSLWMNMPKCSFVQYLLSFVVPLFLWGALCDENMMTTTLISLLLIFALSAFILKIRKPIYSLIAGLVCLPILYFGVGGLAILMPVMLFINIVKKSTKQSIVFLLLSIILFVVCLLISRSIYPYSLERLLRGLHYYRYMQVFPLDAWIATALAAIVVLLASLFPSHYRKPKTQILISAGLGTIIIIGGIRYIQKSMNLEKEEVFAYDYMANNQQWSDILERADKKMPNNPYTVMIHNLALGMAGKLPNNIFQYFQNGIQGLLPSFQMDFYTPMLMAEIYYRLGLINIAKRYVYEAQEGIPDYQESVRATKRLAEFNMINYNYNVAKKHLKTLQQTLYYKDWATEMINLIDNPESIDSHPEYRELRRLNNKTDFFYEDNPPQLLLSLINDCPENRLAYDYLLVSFLLERDLENFYRYFSLGDYQKSNSLPLSYQEALAMIWVQDNKSWEGLPWNLSEDVKHRIEGFLREHLRNMAPDYMRERYSKTFWGYYLYP